MEFNQLITLNYTFGNAVSTGTIAISDSLNCASVTDDGTGDYDPFFTNNNFWTRPNNLE